MPSLTLRLATLSDLPAIARCWYHAFFDDEVIGDMMHPHRNDHPKDVYWFLLRGIRERFWDWRHQFIVVTAREDGKDRLVGAADWRRVGDGGREMELGWADPRNLISLAIQSYHKLSLALWPNRAADPARASFLDSALSSAGKYWTGERAECWDVYVCGVHPDFQRMGVGKMLVEWGTKRVDEESVSASVLCGEKNRKFYTRAGLAEQIGSGTGDIALFRSAKSP
ncbi:acyl-CoA N-acyltransferase [Lophiostoma macrostomum CBS 122681]|uniref:Acyl-CoA N-acyltransferase n=1 Tax=Lophiostoma macrostomum CBS 122681 TaxID=1314788 RepID=A0A6A6TM10_9PLEO|nr:acyl-CoA N-acyltransferase [Lophiostoma macrostomum CBS 122681]